MRGKRPADRCDRGFAATYVGGMPSSGTRFLTSLSLAVTLLAPTVAVANESGYTRAQVAENNRAASCWTIIDGGVYNLTSWGREHPGGSGAIYALCGTDGSSSFSSKHGGQSRPLSELRKYYLGPLVTTAPTPAATASPTASPTATPTATPSATPTQTPVAVTQTPVTTSAAKKRTIVCIKGKTVRKVTGPNPKCPSGFRRR